MTHMVFVYGSLLSGLGNHGLLVQFGASLIGEGSTREKFRMISFGYFPACLSPGEGTPILGEVYEVDDDGLAALDRLEGAPTFYRRRMAMIDLHDGSEMRVVMYVLARRESADLAPVADGDWRNFKGATRC